MHSLVVLLTCFVQGLRHAFDPDHITAITHFVSMDPRPRQGALFGLRWGIGHTITIVIVATIIILLRLRLPEGGPFETGAEIVVGVSLIALGAWRLWVLFRKPHTHLHSHGGIVHAHPHTHVPGSGHVHTHAPTIVGMLHGLAGTAGVLVLIPVSLTTSRTLAFLYIIVFSIGTTLAMSCYAYVAARFYHRAGQSWQQGFNAIVATTAVVGMALGVYWIADTF